MKHIDESKKLVSENVRKELEPTNGRASFGRKAYVEDDGDGFTLISYDTPVARIERCEDGNGQDFSLLSDYLSATTLTHIHSFLHTYGHKDIPTKELKNLDIGEIVHLDNPNMAESRKLVKEGAGAGYTVHIKNLKFGNIMDKKLVKGKKRYDDYYVCQVEILPGEYEIAAEDYYNDFFWEIHEYADEGPTANIDGGVATIVYSTNSYDEEEAEDELRREVSNRKMDISFDYGAGWVHVDLPTDKPIEADNVDVEGIEFYGGIEKLELNAPDLAAAVNDGHQSIYDRDEEDPEEYETEEEDVVTESYNDEWTSVGAAFDEFRGRLWKYTRQDRESRMEFFHDCMRKCEEAFKEYHDACVAED